MATLEPMASAMHFEVEKLNQRRVARLNAPVQDYAQPDDQAELKPVRKFLATMGEKFDGNKACEMRWFKNNNCRDRFFIKRPDGADADATTLASESFHPPKLDVAVGAEAIGTASYWEWLCEDGKWKKFDEPQQAQLNAALAANEQGGSITFKKGGNSYTVDFAAEPQDGDMYAVAGTPWWSVQAKQTNVATKIVRPVRLCDTSCLLSVPQWYDKIASSGATPQTMADLKPLKMFTMKPHPDADGVLRWQHDENGFAFLLNETLTQMPPGVFNKQSDWDPVIKDVLKELKEIIGPHDWPNELGFGGFDTFSKEILSSGLKQGEAPGVCIASMKEFMREHVKRSKHLGKCKGEVGEKVALVKEKLQQAKDLEELRRTIEDYEECAGRDEQLQLEPKLKDLLQSFDYADGLDDSDGLRAACEDFQDRSTVTSSRIDDELLAARRALMRVLAKLAASVQDRLGTMEAMLPEVERRADKVRTDSAELCNTLQTRSKAAQVSVDLTKQQAEKTRGNMMRFEDERTARRRQYESELNGLHDENDNLMNEIRERMNKLYANEIQIRRKTMLDKGDEASHQKKIAECEQNLATLEGCQDEMEKFVVMLNTTVSATQQVAKCADMILVTHPQSIANNIKKDIEQTEHVGREHDTLHFETFCKAWSKTLEDETFVKAGNARIVADIGEIKTDVKIAERSKDETRVQKLKDQRRQLIEQKQRQDEKLTMFKQTMTKMYECPDGHKPADDAEACHCIMPVLERLGRLQAGLCHPCAAHQPWYDLEGDDNFLDRIRPMVTHHCSSLCYDKSGELFVTLEGLDGRRIADGQPQRPKHVDGAVSLPPLDPRPELTRKVMLEAMTVIKGDIEAEERAREVARHTRMETLEQMVPGMKLLDNAPAAGGAGGGGAAMSRTASAKKRAVVQLMQNPEGDPGPSRRA